MFPYFTRVVVGYVLIKLAVLCQVIWLPQVFSLNNTLYNYMKCVARTSWTNLEIINSS